MSRNEPEPVFSIYSIVYKSQTTSLFAHFLPGMSEQLGKDKHSIWQD